jgi:hypothetical protein
MRLLRELPTLDKISIAVRQNCNVSQGVKIPRVDVAGGPGGPGTGPATSKGKGKAVTSVCSDDEVSSDDDHPLRRRRRLLHSDGCPIGGPPPIGQQALVAASMPRSSPSVVAPLTIAPGTSSATDGAAAVSSAAAEKDIMDVAAVKKATGDVAEMQA